MKRIKYDKLGRVVKNSENYKGKKIIKSINEIPNIMSVYNLYGQ